LAGWISLGEPAGGQARGVRVGGISVAVAMRVEVGGGTGVDVGASVGGVSAGNTSVGGGVDVGPRTIVTGPQARVAKTMRQQDTIKGEGRMASTRDFTQTSNQLEFGVQRKIGSITRR
jgi:hypothetical protein